MRRLRFAIWLALGFALLSLLFIVYAVVSFLFVHRCGDGGGAGRYSVTPYG